MFIEHLILRIRYLPAVTSEHFDFLVSVGLAWGTSHRGTKDEMSIPSNKASCRITVTFGAIDSYIHLINYS